MTLGQVVRRLRANRQLTQAELADKLGVERSYISHIETGRIDTPGSDVMRSLAKALGVAPSVLYDAVVNVPPPDDIDLTDPELRVMFEELNGLSELDREEAKEAIRLVRRLQSRRE